MGSALMAGLRGLSLEGLVLMPLICGWAEGKERPNIVFIFSDDHAYQAISSYGSNRNKTPHIDRIGEEGMRFDRCLVPNSICGPSRATVLTGTYSHINGFIDNAGCRFDSSQVTFPKLLQAASYQTVMIGKWHLGSEPTGFDHWQVLPGQGQYYNPKMIRNGENIREKGYVTDIVTDLSLEWLEKERDPSKPFLLMCQHKAPHRNWLPNVTKLNHNGETPFPEPPTLFDDYSGRGPGAREQDMSIAKTMHQWDLKLIVKPDIPKSVRQEWNDYYVPRNQKMEEAQLEGDDLVRWKYQRYMHDYLACISSIDDNVGRVLDYLDESGLAENTIVVYASDQGFYLGEHGWFDKRWIYEESLRTPFLVRWPGVIQAGAGEQESCFQCRFCRDLFGGRGGCGAGPNARPEFAASSSREDASRLAAEFLLSLL